MIIKIQPPHLNRVTTLPREILMSENKRQPEKMLWLTINHKVV